MFNQKFKKGSFFRNFTVLMSGEALAHAFNMVINIILARKLAPDSYGLYALFLTYVTLFFTFSTFGLRRIVIRCIARDQDSSKKYFVISFILIRNSISSPLVSAAWFLSYTVKATELSQDV